MAHYAIGDVQGCFDELMLLLEKIQFDSHQDTLWFVGDIVNRGPKSLDVLRFIYHLGERAICVLGNHDFHLLSLAEDPSKKGQFDTLDEILAAPDCEILLEWLSTRPLLHYDAQLNYVMVHAGIAPQWDLAQAQLLATEVATVLQSRQRKNLLLHLYGDKPDIWSDALTDCSRWRCIINYFTRMRYCRPDGSLNLRHKENPANAPDNLMPWFKVPERKTEHQQIIFGHWASLAGFANTINVFALDTGCVWGEHLTALKLETQEIFSVESLQKSDDINNQ